MDDGTGDSASIDDPARADPAPAARARWPGALLKFAVGATLLAALLWILGPDWGEVRSRFQPHWGYVALAFVGTGLATAVTAARWRLLNESMTPAKLPYLAYFHYTALTRLVGQFTSMLLMDVIGRGLGLRVAGTRQGLGRLLTPVLLERALDVLLPAVMLAWAFAVQRGPGKEHAFALLIAVALVFGLAAVPAIGPVARLAVGAYAWVKRWRGSDPKLEPVEVGRRTAVAVSALSLARYAAVGLQFFAMAAAAGVPLPWEVIAAAFPVAQLSAVLAFTPGGLGIQDAGWAGALAWLGQPEAVIALFLLAVRALIVVNFAVLSLVTLPFARAGQSRTASQ